MKAEEYKSLQFNQIKWRHLRLSEQAILLECPQSVRIEQIHQSAHLIVEILGADLDDIVPSYHSIAVFTSLSQLALASRLNGISLSNIPTVRKAKHLRLPICYELGLDLNRVAKHTGLSETEVMEQHLSKTYRAAFIGFTPGFIYADGLEENLSCPRLDNPRKRVPSGSVGIGGNQTGIYSLASPGGWNILGLTPVTLFDKEKKPPMTLHMGDTFQFYAISKKEFESWAG